MKRSRSGTRSRRAKRARRRPAFGLALAVLAVLAFVASFVFGLNPGSKERPAPPPPIAPAPAPVAVPDSRVRIEVLNGSRKPGLARLATDQLRDAGYDVVYLGNARAPANESVVFDRVGKREIAERVAQTLAIARVQTQVDTTRYLEVTVVLGSDWSAMLRPATSN